MLHTHDVLRRRLEPADQLNTEELKRSEWSPRFEQLMRNRMIIGAFRYGRLHDKMKPRFDRVSYIKTKLARYEETGNLEALVDVANLCLLEFEEGRHPKKHFKALDATDEHCEVKVVSDGMRKLMREELNTRFDSVSLGLEEWKPGDRFEVTTVHGEVLTGTIYQVLAEMDLAIVKHDNQPNSSLPPWYFNSTHGWQLSRLRRLKNEAL